MKLIPATALFALLAPLAAADVESIEREFDLKLEEARKTVLGAKLVALEGYANDDANKGQKDVVRAMFEAAQIAAQLERHEVARDWATKVLASPNEGGVGARARLIAGVAVMRLQGDGAKVTELLSGAIDMAQLTIDSVNTTLAAADELSRYLVEQGDKPGAERTWEAVRAKLQHPNIANLVRLRLSEIALIGTAPAAFQVKDLASKDLDLEQYKGRVVLLDFWATWCGPYLGDLPNIVGAYKRFHAEGFEIVGISLDSDRTVLDAFLESHEMPWRQFFDGKGQKNELAQLYGVQSIPATYLIDRDGKVAHTNLRGDALPKAVARLLAKK